MTEWLLEQIQLDRQRAWAWQHDTGPDGRPFYACPATRTEPLGDLPFGEENCTCGLEQRRHRVLVDCDMLEQIIRQHLDWQTTLHDTPADRTEGECTTYRMAMEWTVDRIAMMFDDRPGWDEQWGWVRDQVESWPVARPSA